MSEWHADATALRDYAQGRGSDAAAWSVETHLPICATCRDTLGQLLTDHDRTLLAQVRTTLELAPQRRRRATRSVVAEGVLGPWWVWTGLIALTLALLVLVGHAPIGAGPRQFGLSWALLLAPVVPVAMVAGGYALVDVDAAADVSARGGMELALMRAAVVLAVSVTTVFAGLRLSGVVEVAWLLPGLGLSIAAVAIGHWVGVERAAVALTGLWAGLVVAATVPASSLLAPVAPLIAGSGQGAASWAVVIVAALAALIIDGPRHVGSPR